LFEDFVEDAGDLVGAPGIGFDGVGDGPFEVVREAGEVIEACTLSDFVEEEPAVFG